MSTRLLSYASSKSLHSMQCSATRIFFSDNLRHLSFLRTSDTSLNPRDRNYHFIHLTYQEYFAARYFVHQWKSRGPLVDATTSQNVDPAVRFLQVIEEEPRDLFGPSHQRLVMRCLSETLTKSPFRVNLDHTLSEWLLFETNYAVFPKLVQTHLSDEVRNYIAEKLEKKSLQEGRSSKDLLMFSRRLAAKVLDERSKMLVKATMETPRGSDEFFRFIFDNEPIQASSVGEMVWDEFGRIRDTMGTGLQQIEEGYFSRSGESGYVGESGENYSSEVSDESDSDSPWQPRERAILLNDEADAERSRLRLLGHLNEIFHGGERRKSAYSMLLQDSFRETLTWYVEDDTSYLYHPGEVSKTLIDDAAQLNKDMHEIHHISLASDWLSSYI
ncbi:hypothetical protein F4774DRAFT_421452 [Daldinia eschscholtzii]|nr:hypothetical protein F4774DRAFT_421452 [Daldinia eschscholtzii]